MADGNAAHTRWQDKPGEQQMRLVAQIAGHGPAGARLEALERRR
jgi:hypothetical protein